MRVLALDVGDRRIGVALSDPTGLIATPLTAFQRGTEAEDIDAVLALVSEHDVELILVGMPLTLAGQVGPQARRVDHFVRTLSGQTAVTVTAVDERYSTVEAEKRMREAGGRPSLDRARVDAAAAAVVLQGYLDARRGAPG